MKGIPISKPLTYKELNCWRVPHYLPHSHHCWI